MMVFDGRAIESRPAAEVRVLKRRALAKIKRIKKRVDELCYEQELAESAVERCNRVLSTL